MFKKTLLMAIAFISMMVFRTGGYAARQFRRICNPTLKNVRPLF